MWDDQWTCLLASISWEVMASSWSRGIEDCNILFSFFGRKAGTVDNIHWRKVYNNTRQLGAAPQGTQGKNLIDLKINNYNSDAKWQGGRRSNLDKFKYFRSRVWHPLYKLVLKWISSTITWLKMEAFAPNSAEINFGRESQFFWKTNSKPKPIWNTNLYLCSLTLFPKEHKDDWGRSVVFNTPWLATSVNEIIMPSFQKIKECHSPGSSWKLKAGDRLSIARS